MKIFDIIKMALKNLWRRKGRTFLTVSGVVIGSCAVITMISLGLGMNLAMDNMLASWGDLTAVTIYNYNWGGNTETVSLDDSAIEAITAIENVEYVIPKLRIDGNMVTLAAGRSDRYRMDWADIYGVDFSLLDKMGYLPETGELPTEDQYDKTIVFGNEVAYNFRDTRKRGEQQYTWKQYLEDGTFTQPFFDPVGENILVGVNDTKNTDDEGNYRYGGRGYEYELECVTVLQQDPNWETVYSVLIDIDVAKEIIADYNKRNKIKDADDPQYNNVKVVCKDIDSVEEVEEQIEAMGFNCSSMADTRNEMKKTLSIIQLVLGCLAAVSLFVAALSITNTMVMSIYERTREIGIMKVLGCYVSNIRLSFLVEAGLIGLLGGIIGTVLSYGLSFGMNYFGKGMLSQLLGFGGGDTPISIIPLWLVLLALGFSTLIGLISGFSPANRAVKISALEAIKSAE